MSAEIKVSVIIPAHNEEKYVVRCIDSVKLAASCVKCGVEIIVVCNRCTDRTAELAAENGARVVTDESRCIATVRNAGIKAARGKVIVTIDCDNRMTEGTLREILGMLNSGKYIGGGAPLRFERYSAALWINDIMCRAGFGITGLYCGIFWAEKRTFDAIGGFVEKKAGEDIATAKALRAYGKKCGKKYGCLRRNHLINSTRKYDDMGDWLYFRLAFRNAGALIRAASGDSSDYDKLMDEMFYDYNDNKRADS
ncbi:glycosyltransferase [Ruminococcus flavefaciens]|uniref:glycosyltransferase n=1 Tax=Ruminococcus flavefaciens TaxID=1265 RepID=UPI0026F0D2B7|nr:glycosyltransferase [Ruminococcus flavefaciens]MDD7515750.1 glycosyltransferase [Ruminococcus flavefaciens]MDY5692828.1 glycosyltransferase [Ruminococcus flavefaciens]